MNTESFGSMTVYGSKITMTVLTTPLSLSYDSKDLSDTIGVFITSKMTEMVHFTKMFIFKMQYVINIYKGSYDETKTHPVLKIKMTIPFDFIVYVYLLN